MLEELQRAMVLVATRIRDRYVMGLSWQEIVKPASGLTLLVIIK